MDYEQTLFILYLLDRITKHWALEVQELDSGVATLRLTWNLDAIPTTRQISSSNILHCCWPELE